MERNQKNERGITLIALVVTIIVLIILAGVSISLVLGDNGIITKARAGKRDYSVAQYIEKVELSRGTVAIEKEGTVNLDDLIHQIYIDKIVPEGYIRKMTEEKAEMLTEEGYIFIITADTIEYVGKGKASEKNLSISEAEWNNGKASVVITKGEEASESSVVQYQVNGTEEGNWKEGTSVGELKHNDIVYARLQEGKEGGGLAIRAIIDTVDPQDAQIELSNIPTEENSQVTATVLMIDNESNVDMAKSKWTCSGLSGEIGTDENLYERNFTGEENPQTIELYNTMPGPCYLHVLTQDKAGNKKETVIGVNIWISGIKLNKTSTSIYKGITETLSVEAIEPDNATNKNVIWSSSDETIATVVNGVVTAKEVGTVTITATATDGSGIAGNCIVTVPDVKVLFYEGKILNRI